MWYFKLFVNKLCIYFFLIFVLKSKIYLSCLYVYELENVVVEINLVFVEVRNIVYYFKNLEVDVG